MWGQRGAGEFDYRATRALDSLSMWMQANSKSIYGCTFAPEGFAIPAGTRLTYNPATKRLYVHLFTYPEGNLTLPGYGGKVQYAQFLHDASEIQTADKKAIGTSEAGSDVVLALPAMNLL